MKTASMQGELWGAKAADWTELGEPVSLPAWRAVFNRAGLTQGTRLLDMGCGAGGALVEAQSRGADVSGLDASEALVAIARSRVPQARIEIGDLEEVPFDDQRFDLVTGFNSFQFVGDMPRALREARRVVRPGGQVGVCLWAAREECESVLHTFTPVMALLPPPPPSSAPPLSSPGVLEGMLNGAGLTPQVTETVDIPFVFADAATAWRCFASAGLMVGAIRQAGEEAVRNAILTSLPRFTRPDGSIVQQNRFRWVLARRDS